MASEFLASLLRSKASTPDLAAPPEDADLESTTPEEAMDETTKAMQTAAPSKMLAETVPLTDLVFVIHGIGQRLATKYASFSFIHAVNTLRANANKNCTDPAFSELADGRRIQFLPLLWRSTLNLEQSPEDSVVDSENEHLSNRFAVADIEPSGLPFIRELISNVLIDIPSYMSHHRSGLLESIVREANRLYRLFCLRNPDFDGRGRVQFVLSLFQTDTRLMYGTSLIAHSLGAPLAMDILSKQPTKVPLIKELSFPDLQSTTQFCFNTHTCFVRPSLNSHNVCTL